MQGLVRVDVADAGDRALVEEHSLERRAPLAQPAVQLVGGEIGVDRLRAEARHLLRGQQRVLGADQQATEPPRVAIAQLATTVQEEHGVRVLLQPGHRVDQAELAGHTEMDDQQQIPLLPDSPDYPWFRTRQPPVSPD